MRSARRSFVGIPNNLIPLLLLPPTTTAAFNTATSPSSAPIGGQEHSFSSSEDCIAKIATHLTTTFQSQSSKLRDQLKQLQQQEQDLLTQLSKVQAHILQLQHDKQSKKESLDLALSLITTTSNTETIEQQAQKLIEAHTLQLKIKQQQMEHQQHVFLHQIQLEHQQHSLYKQQQQVSTSGGGVGVGGCTSSSNNNLAAANLAAGTSSSSSSTAAVTDSNECEPKRKQSRLNNSSLSPATDFYTLSSSSSSSNAVAALALGASASSTHPALNYPSSSSSSTGLSSAASFSSSFRPVPKQRTSSNKSSSKNTPETSATSTPFLTKSLSNGGSSSSNFNPSGSNNSSSGSGGVGSSFSSTSSKVQQILTKTTDYDPVILAQKLDQGLLPACLFDKSHSHTLDIPFQRWNSPGMHPPSFLFVIAMFYEGREGIERGITSFCKKQNIAKKGLVYLVQRIFEFCNVSRFAGYLASAAAAGRNCNGELGAKLKNALDTLRKVISREESKWKRSKDHFGWTLRSVEGWKTYEWPHEAKV